MKEKIKQLIRYRALVAWYNQYERVLLPATLLVGVVIDSLTFTKIQITSAFLLFLVYTLLVSGCIIYFHSFDAGRIPEKIFWKYLRLAMPLVIQFFFGALLSGIFIFYVFSGSVFVSWPFFLVLVLLMVGNDVFREHYLRFPVQMNVYFFILFGLFSIVLPFVTYRMGILPFAGAAVAALLVFFLYIKFLFRIIPPLQRYQTQLLVSAIIIVSSLHIAYLAKLIPPIPLSLRTALVAHEVSHRGGNYEIVRDQQPWTEWLIPGQKITKKDGEPLYVYTAIFAPSRFHTKIVHHWQWYDEQKKAWVSKDRLSFSLTGARQDGYRGFSKKTTVPYGRWRVDVETVNGQTLGRINFRVVEPNQDVVLETILE